MNSLIRQKKLIRTIDLIVNHSMKYSRKPKILKMNISELHNHNNIINYHSKIGTLQSSKDLKFNLIRININ